MAVGADGLSFEGVTSWPNIPQEVGFVEAVGVACGQDDLVYVFARAEIPVLVFTTSGEYVRGWGSGLFVRPHGITLTAEGTLFLVDDIGHSVREFSSEGRELRKIGPAGEPSDSGAEGFDYRQIRSGACPYNLPTNLIPGPDGQLYVTDGYGNARVHQFAASGEYLRSWGEPGTGPGQFQVPHGIAADGERLYVCDRENSRVQVFTLDGDLVAIWTDLVRPAQAIIDPDGLVYVFELGVRTGNFPWESPDPEGVGGRLSIFTRDGELVSRWGGGRRPESPEDFYAPHDLCLDRHGDLYTAEVKTAAAVNPGHDTSHLPSLRKFRRKSQSL